MPRLIDADALLKKKLRTQMFGLDWEMVFAKDIEDAPTIDLEILRAHGRWEKAAINGYLCCSVCKDVYIYEGWLESGKWIFCPKCGAKMDEV